MYKMKLCWHPQCNVLNRKFTYDFFLRNSKVQMQCLTRHCIVDFKTIFIFIFFFTLLFANVQLRLFSHSNDCQMYCSVLFFYLFCYIFVLWLDNKILFRFVTIVWTEKSQKHNWNKQIDLSIAALSIVEV